jgi:hypothetical protein
MKKAAASVYKAMISERGGTTALTTQNSFIRKTDTNFAEQRRP